MKWKNNKSDEMDASENKKKKKSKFKWILLPIILVGLGCGIYFGRSGIAGVVKNVPILNQIFKIKSQGTSENNQVKEDPKVKELEMKIEQLNQDLTNIQNENEALNSQVKVLKQYEMQYNDFQKQKQEWEKEVASQSAIEYIKYYERINPDHASEIYKELKQTQIATQEQKQYAKVVADMTEEEAAKAIEKIVVTDPELVKYLFAGMASDRKSVILSVMDEQVAPQVIKLIAP